MHAADLFKTYVGHKYDAISSESFHTLDMLPMRLQNMYSKY